MVESVAAMKKYVGVGVEVCVCVWGWGVGGGGGLAKYLTGKRAILYFCEITTIFYKPEDHDDVIKWKSAPELSFGSE